MSLTRKAGIFTLSKAVTIIVQVLAMAILARVLSKEEFGLLSFLLLAYATVQTLGQLGLPDSVFYFFEKLPKESRKSICLLIASLLLTFSLAGTVIVGAIGWVGASQEGFGEAKNLVWVFMLLLLFELPTIPLPNVLIALDKAKSAAWFNLFAGVSQFLAMTLPLQSEQPVVAITYGLLGYGVLRCAVSAFIFFNLFREEEKTPLPPGTLREILNYSVPLSVAQIFWSLNRQIDKYAVQWFLPIAAFAEYTAGAWEIPIVPTIAYSIASVMMPQLVGHHLRGEKEQLLDLWFRSIRKVSVIVLPLVVFFFVAAEEFIVLLFSEKYMEAAVPFRIYTLILLQRVASYSNMQKALGSTKVITYAAVFLLLINGSLCVPLVLWLGIAGPPLASLLANTFTWWYSLSKIGELLKIRFREVFPFAYYLKVLGVAAFAGLPFFLLKNQWEIALALKLPLLLTGYGLLYLLLAYLTNLVEEEDWRRLRRVFGRKG